jgi:uncharacterized protein (DUF1697 family)
VTRRALAPRLALLRGINVGKAKRIAMPALKATCEGRGFERVETFLATGNVLFVADAKLGLDLLETRLEAAIENELGVRCRVTVLAESDLDQILDDNPLSEATAEPSRLLVSVLRRATERAKAEPLTRQDWSPEVLGLGRRSAYLWCKGGISAGKLALAFDKALKDGGTARNWTTLQKLRGKLKALAAPQE